MRATLERIRRMLATFGLSEDGDSSAAVASGSRRSRAGRQNRGSRFERSNSFKRSSMRRGGTSRRGAAAPHRKPVVTNRGIYYVDEGDSVLADSSLVQSSTTTRTSTVDSSSSFSDWIQVTDDENSTLGQKITNSASTTVVSSAKESLSGSALNGAKRRRKKTNSRNFLLEGKSVPFDSPLPSGQRLQASTHETFAADSTVNISVSGSVASASRAVTTGANSTFGSSCTSGVHSMEKSGVPVAAGRSRRGAPTVLAMKPRLRHSGRKGTGRRHKKAPRHLVDAAGSREEVYRVFSQLPLLFDTPDASTASGTSGSTVRSPISFNRQNPITRWLEESERLQRSGNVAGGCDGSRVPPEIACPLWSELVNHVSPYMTKTESSNTNTRPDQPYNINAPSSSGLDKATLSSCEGQSSTSSPDAVYSARTGAEDPGAVRGVVRARRASVCQRLTDSWKRLSVAAVGSSSSSGFASVDRSIASVVDITV